MKYRDIKVINDSALEEARDTKLYDEMDELVEEYLRVMNNDDKWFAYVHQEISIDDEVHLYNFLVDKCGEKKTKVFFSMGVTERLAAFITCKQTDDCKFEIPKVRTDKGEEVELPIKVYDLLNYINDGCRAFGLSLSLDADGNVRIGGKDKYPPIPRARVMLVDADDI